MKIELLKENPELWCKNASLDDIETVIDKAADLYYNSSETFISDYVYDILIDRYRILTKNKGKCIKVGSDIKGQKTLLPTYMGSMDKEKSITGIDKWCKKQATDNFVITPKIDGSSALLVFDCQYNQCKLYSRGNGTYGKDISHLLKILGINELLNKFGKINNKNIQKIIIRGELIIKKMNIKKYLTLTLQPEVMLMV